MNKVPNFATGAVIPNGVLEVQLKEAKEAALRKKQFRHDWMIACFSSVTGAIFGFLASLIFWLIAN